MGLMIVWPDDRNKEAIDYVQRREAFAERVRETVRRAEIDPETWIVETLETEEILG